MKRNKLFAGLLALICLIGTAVPAFAETGAVLADEFFVSDYVNNIPVVVNKDDVKGDILALSQRLVMDGTVKGDILGYTGELAVGGLVDGNIRAVGTTAHLSGQVSRNLMFGGSIFSMSSGATINGNVYIAATTIDLSGQVMGRTTLFGERIQLNGQFMGDVDLNKEPAFGGTANQPSYVKSLDIGPDTYIAGTLTVRAEEPPTVPDTAHIGKLEFIQVNPAQPEKPTIRFKPILRDVLTALLFFLFALLLYRIVPRFFVRQADYLRNSFLATAGIGIAALGTIVASIILLFILGVLTFFLFNFSVFGFAVTVFGAFVTITGALTTLPVSLWLGRVLLGETKSVPATLAAGLSIVTLVRILLNMASILPVVGGVIGVVYWIIQLAIWLMGMGAILHGMSDFIKSANRGADIPEDSFDLTI